MPRLNDRLLILPLLLAVLPWLPVLGAPLMVDDRVLYYEARKWLGLDWMAPWHLPLGGSGTWRPLGVYAFWIDAGLPASLQHATNLLLHAALVAVGHGWLRGRVGREAACVGACLLAVYPPHAANLGWIAGRADLLMGLLAASALWAWDREQVLRCALFAIAAVLVKETAIALVPMLLLLRVDRRAVLPVLGVSLAFAFSVYRAVPQPGYWPDPAQLGAVASLWPPFLVETAVPWFAPLGVPKLPRDVLGLAAAVPVASGFVLLGWQLPQWRRGVGLALLALLPVLHVLPNDGGQWYLLLPSLGVALAWASIAELLPRWRIAAGLLVVTALLAAWEASAWQRAAVRVDATIEAVRAGAEEAPAAQDLRTWPHRGPSFCCGMPYQVLEDWEPGWAPIFELAPGAPPQAPLRPAPESRGPDPG